MNAASATVSNVGRWDDWHKSWPRANCSNGNVMVRLSDQRSADRLPTFSRHCHLFVNINQTQQADAPHIPDACIYLLECNSLSHALTVSGYTVPSLSTTPSRSNPPSPPRVQPGPSAALNRASPGWATNCAHDVERRPACASCGPLPPPYREPLGLHLRTPSLVT